MSELAPTAALLSQVFPGSDVSSPGYLRWLYQESPFGPVIGSSGPCVTGSTR